MENNNENLDKSLEFKKEEKYRNEIFQLLKTNIDTKDLEMIALFDELFLNEAIDNNQLLNRITTLK
jgi:hypothetical protein